MNRFFYIFSLLFVLNSCSIDKRATRAIKRIGAEPIAVALTKLRPDLLRGDTVYIDTIIKIPFEVKVPEFIYDTTYTDTSTTCKKILYEDKKLFFQSYLLNGKNNVIYKIKTQTYRDTAKKRIYIDKPCPPCPGKNLIEEIKKQNQIQINKLNQKIEKIKWQRKWLIIILCSIILILIFKRILPILLNKIAL
jgi:hypothetical protein